MNFRIAQTSDINDIVTFHKKNFKNYYLTNLGENILKKYYCYFIQDQKNFCNICELDGELVAISLYVKRYDEQMNRFYSENKKILSKAILSKVLKMNRVIIKGTLSRVTNILKNQEPFDLPDVTLLSLATDSTYQSQGIGKQLIVDSEKIMSDRGITEYYLSVLPENERAIQFYENNGFIRKVETRKLIYLTKRVD